MLQTPDLSPEVVHQFRNFVDRAEALAQPRIDSFSVGRFRALIQTATPLVLEPARELLARVAAQLNVLSDFLIPSQFDLLYVAGFEYAEDPYTELMRWAMDPQFHPSLALDCQRSWLHSLGVFEGINAPADPRSQVGTVNGVPDLVMLYEQFVVVVEAKTGSSEHGARGGDVPQTLAYPAAVRESLQLPTDFPTHMVYLTPDRSPAANEDALLATYLGFALVMAETLSKHGGELPDALKWSFAALITHFAICAVPSACDVRLVLQLHQSQRDSRLGDADLLGQFPAIKMISELLKGE